MKTCMAKVSNNQGSINFSLQFLQHGTRFLHHGAHKSQWSTLFLHCQMLDVLRVIRTFSCTVLLYNVHVLRGGER